MGQYLDRMTVKELDEFLVDCRTVIFPIAIVEQHGFHLPLRTDIDNVEKFLDKCIDKIDAAVAPTLPYCYSGGELTGTINVSPNVFSLFAVDIIDELIRNGFTNVVILLGHGGSENRHALEHALKMYLKKRKDLKKVTLSLIEIFYLSQTWMDAFKTGIEKDFHAGLVETSLMKYWNPDLVKDDIVMDEKSVAKMMRTDQDWFETQEKIYDHEFIIPVAKQREEIKVGVMGFPEKATAEYGKAICDEMIESLVDYIRKLHQKNPAQ